MGVIIDVFGRLLTKTDDIPETIIPHLAIRQSVTVVALYLIDSVGVKYNSL